MDSISEEEREHFLNADEAKSNSNRSLNEPTESASILLFDARVNELQKERRYKPLIVKCKSVECLCAHVSIDETLCLQKKLSKSVNVIGDERKLLASRSLSLSSKSLTGSESSCTCRQELRYVVFYLL